MQKSMTIYIAGAGPVLFERSCRAKHINITVRPFRGVRVAVPRGVSFAVAEQIARSRADWMITHLARTRRIEKKYTEAPRFEIDRETARKVLTERIAAIARQHGYTYNRVTIRNQKTRWGSCSSRNNISLNVKLTLLPDDLRDFVLLHELVHTRVKNHGKAFWAELIRAEPRARELARQVNQQSVDIFRPDTSIDFGQETGI